MRALLVGVASLLLVAVPLAGCGGGGSSAPESHAVPDANGSGATLASAPSVPPLVYQGKVEVRFISYAAEPVTTVTVGYLQHTAAGPLLGDGAFQLGVLEETGMYPVRVEFDGRPTVTANLFLGWPTVTVFLFP